MSLAKRTTRGKIKFFPTVLATRMHDYPGRNNNPLAKDRPSTPPFARISWPSRIEARAKRQFIFKFRFIKAL